MSSNNRKPKSAWRTKTIICPHCYHDHGAKPRAFMPKVVCLECGKKFRVEVETEILYTSCKVFEISTEVTV